jgi:hypothetical protein
MVSRISKVTLVTVRIFVVVPVAAEPETGVDLNNPLSNNLPKEQRNSPNAIR